MGHFLSLPTHYNAYRIRLRVKLEIGSHTFSPLVSQMTVYNMVADETLALMCWNTEVKTKFETYGYAIAKTDQNNLLELGNYGGLFPTPAGYSDLFLQWRTHMSQILFLLLYSST